MTLEQKVNALAGVVLALFAWILVLTGACIFLYVYVSQLEAGVEYGLTHMQSTLVSLYDLFSEAQ